MKLKDIHCKGAKPKDKLTAILQLGLQYFVFIFLLLLSIGIATESVTAGLILAVPTFLILPAIREKFIPDALRHPLLTAVLIIAAFFTSLNASDEAVKTNREKKQQEITEVARQQKEKDLAEFTANPQPKLDEIKNLIEQEIYGNARYQIDALKEADNDGLNALNEQLLQIEGKIEEDRRKAEAEAAEEQRITKAAALWSYSHRDDPMSKGITHTALLRSTNTVNFDFPYNGAQHGTLMLRTDPKYGKDVIFSIEKGQILCPSYDSCTVRVRFDEEDSTSYTAVGAADNSTETIFIRNYSRFVGKMMKAKRVRISMNIYQEGAPVFDFDVSGFNVNKYKPSKIRKESR